MKIKIVFLLIVFCQVNNISLTAQSIPEGYYNGTEGLVQGELQNSLHNILRDHKPFRYAEIIQIIEDVDQDPDNADNIILFYTGRSQPKNQFGSNSNDWNREHTWPSSHGFPDQEDSTYSDAHNLRPSRCFGELR